MGIPDLEKAGKAVQLKRAVEYMAEMGERLGGVDKELEDLRREKQDLEVCRTIPTGSSHPVLRDVLSTQPLLWTLTLGLCSCCNSRADSRQTSHSRLRGIRKNTNDVRGMKPSGGMHRIERQRGNLRLPSCWMRYPN